MNENTTRFGVIVPVKPPALAKTRLGGLGERFRRDLAAAFAVDTVTATLATPGVGLVLAVTDDHALAAQLAGIGAAVLPDGTTEDLNESLALAAVEVARRRPDLRLAALCADLPALRPEQLARALSRAPAREMGFVADAPGLGTTLVTAPDLATFRPRFGAGSRQAHLDAGATEIDSADLSTLRRDVDTPADLAEALGLGIGRRSSQVTADLF